MKGYTHVYTGDGKGKTTAAFGLALRAAGAGLRVFIAQFVKGMEYSELEAIKRFPGSIELAQCGTRCFITDGPKQEDVDCAVRGFELAREAIFSGNYDLVILDEINIALYFNLIEEADVLALINEKPDNIELVLTGRKASSAIIDAADLVTEMREVKHYYNDGVLARKGIES